MKMTIGQKIKKIRLKKDMKQTAIHNNQSQISQIESGKISNPDEGTIKMIAKNLDVSFDELIEDTDWSAPEKKAGQYAFSPNAYEFKIDEDNFISYRHKYYPLYDDGIENKFCIETGDALISKCEICDREIKTIDQIFCSGCGKRLFKQFEISYKTKDLIASDHYNLDNHFMDSIGIVEQEINCLDKFQTFLTKSNDIKEVAELKISMQDKRMLRKLTQKELEKKNSELFTKNNFKIQLFKTLEKHLKSKSKEMLRNTKEFNPKEELYKRIAGRIDESTSQLIDSEYQVDLLSEKMLKMNDKEKQLAMANLVILNGQIEKRKNTIRELSELLRTIDSTEDLSGLDQKLDNVDLDETSETQSSDEKISEDGNSETVAADTKAEPKKKNTKLNKPEKK